MRISQEDSQTDLLSQAPMPLSQILKNQALGLNREHGYAFIGEDGNKTTITYHELFNRAKIVASHIIQKTNKHDRVLLIYPPGLDYIIGFFGVVFSGRIAVPVYPPATSQFVRTLQSIIDDCQPAALLSNNETISKLKKLKYLKKANKLPVINVFVKRLKKTFIELTEWDLNQIIWLNSCTMKKESYNTKLPEINLSDIAFLQYTSGSTNQPKGVCITHEKLFNNQRLIYKILMTDRESNFISWLPPYHDMGLIGVILHCCYVGCKGTMISPMTFIKNPYAWLKLCSGTKNCITGAPNFAFDLCVRKISIDQKKDIDLSGLSTLVCSAEPIQEKVIDRFFNYFSECHLDRKVFFPAYGLAEGTLIVAGRYGLSSISKLKNDHGSTMDIEFNNPIVNCGFPQEKLLILDNATSNILPENSIGQIIIAGKSVAKKYWNEKANEKAFIYINDERYFKTGDYGFLNQNELYVTGRIKETIIIAGKNYFPHDIEYTVNNKIPEIHKGSIIAFGINDGVTDRLVIACELNEKQAATKELVDRIRHVVFHSFKLPVSAVVILKRKTIQKTTSGKLKRTALKNSYIDGTLDALPLETDSKRLKVNVSNEHPLLLIIRELLALPASDKIDTSKSLMDLGIDSLGYISLQERLEDNFPDLVKNVNFLNLAAVKNIDHAILMMDELIQKPAIASSRKEVTEPKAFNTEMKSTSGNAILSLLRSNSGVATFFKKLSGMHRVMNIDNKLGLQKVCHQYIQNLNIKIHYNDIPNENTIREAPLIIISNHPTTINDGIVILNKITKIRDDIKIVGNKLLKEFFIEKYIVPVNLYDAKQVDNLKAYQEMREWLQESHAIFITPAGRISNFHFSKWRYQDYEWKETFLSLREKTKANILPVNIDIKPVKWLVFLAKFPPFIRNLFVFRLAIGAAKNSYTVNFGRVIEPHEDIKNEKIYQFCNGNIDTL